MNSLRNFRLDTVATSEDGFVNTFSFPHISIAFNKFQALKLEIKTI